MSTNNSLAKKNSNPSFPAFIKSDQVLNSLSKTLGSETKKNRFVSSIISAVSTNPSLQKCDYNSIVNCALLGESLDLTPSPQLGQYYMVPYSDKAQFQLGYKGYIQLAIRSGVYKKLNVMAIKEGELIKYDPLNEVIEVNLIEDEVERENATTIGYYAMFEYKEDYGSFRKTMYWSKAKMENHAKTYSKAFNTSSSFWKKDFDAMAYKTMLRQLISKWGVMSVEFQNAFEKDIGAIKDDGSVEYIDSFATEEEPQQDIPKETVQEVKKEADILPQEEQPQLL